MCVNSLPRLALYSGVAGIWTHDLLITSPVPHRYATEPHHVEVYWSNSTRQTERMWQVLSCIFSSFAYRYQLGPQLKFITMFSKPDDLLPCCTFLHVVKLQESLRVVRLTTIHRDPTLITENEDIRRFAQTFVFCLFWFVTCQNSSWSSIRSNRSSDIVNWLATFI